MKFKQSKGDDVAIFNRVKFTLGNALSSRIHDHRSKNSLAMNGHSDTLQIAVLRLRQRPFQSISRGITNLTSTVRSELTVTAQSPK